MVTVALWHVIVSELTRHTLLYNLMCTCMFLPSISLSIGINCVMNLLATLFCGCSCHIYTSYCAMGKGVLGRCGKLQRPSGHQLTIV